MTADDPKYDAVSGTADTARTSTRIRRTGSFMGGDSFVRAWEIYNGSKGPRVQRSKGPRVQGSEGPRVRGSEGPRVWGRVCRGSRLRKTRAKRAASAG